MEQVRTSSLFVVIFLILLLSFALPRCVPATVVSLSEDHVTLKRDPTLYKQDESALAAEKHCGSMNKKSEFITTTQATVFSHAYDHYKCLKPESPQ